MRLQCGLLGGDSALLRFAQLDQLHYLVFADLLRIPFEGDFRGRFQFSPAVPILPCFPNSFGNANTLASVQVLRTVCEDSTKSRERSEREAGEVSDRS